MNVGEWWRTYSQEMRDSSVILNELMAITTEYEDTVFNIGKETYVLYRKNQIFDLVTVDICKRIESVVHDLEKYKQDFVDFEEFVAGDLSKAGVGGKVSFKLKQGANNFFLNRELDSRRSHLREAYEDLGKRIYTQSTGDAITNNPRIRRMILYAGRVKADSEAKWKELRTRQKEKQRGPSFNIIFSNFFVSLMRYAGSHVKSFQEMQVVARQKIKTGYQNIHYNADKSSDGPLKSDTVVPAVPQQFAPPTPAPSSAPPNWQAPPAAAPKPQQNWPMGGPPGGAPPSPPPQQQQQNWPMQKPPGGGGPAPGWGKPPSSGN